eukprot:2327595-Rhodomonas_salina.2
MTILEACYAMSGADIGCATTRSNATGRLFYLAISRRTCCAMSCADLAQAAPCELALTRR